MKILSDRLMSLIFALLVFGYAFSQDQRVIKSDKLQLRKGLYYTINEEKPYSGKVLEYFSNGKKKLEKSIKDGKLHGMIIKWNYDGIKESEISFENGLKWGPYRIWNNGQPKEEGAYKAGKEDGEWIYWFDNGGKQKECSYIEGTLEGPYIKWNYSGKKIYEGICKKGLFSGRAVSWNDGGEKVSEGTLENDKKIGQWVFWNESGQKIKQQNYVLDTLNGVTSI